MRALAALLLSGCCGVGLSEAPTADPPRLEARSVVPERGSQGAAEAAPPPGEDLDLRDLSRLSSRPAVLFSAPVVVPGRILSMCAPDDVIVWNCALPDEAGAISLCAADRQGAWVQLRAGHPDRPLVAVPSTRDRASVDLTFREEETGDGSILTIAAREPGRVATLTVRSAESPSGLLEPALLRLDVTSDSGDATTLSCDVRHGFMSDGGLLEALLTRAP